MTKVYCNKEGGDTIFYTKSGGVAVEILKIDSSGALKNSNGDTYNVEPVGTVKQSILSEVQFQAAMGAGWVIMRGQDITGSKLHSVAGMAVLPDARGRFLRTAEGGATAVGVTQEQSTSATGLGGTADGQTYSGVSQIHEQITSRILANDAGSNPGMLQPASGWAGFSSMQAFVADITHTHGASNLNITGSTETRPANLAVNTFIKIN